MVDLGFDWVGRERLGEEKEGERERGEGKYGGKNFRIPEENFE